MQIIRAKKKHLSKIRELLSQCGKGDIESCDLNSRDIGLIALEDQKVVGFIWCGLMSQGRFGYISKFAILPEYSGKGVAKAIGIAMLEHLYKSKVKDIFGIIRQDRHHDKSAFNALKFAMGAKEDPYTYVYANINNTINELRGLDNG